MAAAGGEGRAPAGQPTEGDDICEAAGLTKGSFFHHFESKEELAISKLKAAYNQS